MFLYGVVNASPDSLHTASIATDANTATTRANYLLTSGCQGLDLGGQGSTDSADLVSWQDEWARVEAVLPTLAKFGVPLSIDSWRPEVTRRALQHGATVINAADGMQTEEMWEIAADFRVPIVVPFLSGANPRSMSMVRDDPLHVMVEFFTQRLRVADRFGLRSLCILDPGTGFAPANWPWEERYRYQRHVYANLDTLRVFDLPLYVAMPWKETPQHQELLEIIVRQQPEYGRVHYPERVRQAEREMRQG